MSNLKKRKKSDICVSQIEIIYDLKDENISILNIDFFPIAFFISDGILFLIL